MDSLNSQSWDPKLLNNIKPLDTKCTTMLVSLIPGVTLDSQCCWRHALILQDERVSLK